MLQHTEQQRILDILKKLPPDKLHEVVDFAEYLKTKEIPAKAMKKPRHVTFTTFLFGRMIGCAAEIDDHINRGRNMDTRTPASSCSFVG